MEDKDDLLDKLAIYSVESEGRGRILFPEYLAHDVIQNGIRNGKFKKATFQVFLNCFGICLKGFYLLRDFYSIYYAV